MPKIKKRLTDFLSVSDSDITFLNIEVVDDDHLSDAKVFILPSYLQKVRVDGFDSQKALRSVTSFFNTILKIVNSSSTEKQKITELKLLFKPIHEVGSLGLGYSEQNSKGHGPDYESLVQIGLFINKVITKFKATGNLDDLIFPKSLPIFAPNFGPDALSDLISVLIYPELLKYTKFVLNKLNVAYKESDVPEKVAGDDRKIWNPDQNKWVLASGPISVKGLKLTLIPYQLLTPYDGSLNVNRYITVFLLEKLRKIDEKIDNAIKAAVRKEYYVRRIPDKKKYALEATESEMTVFTEFLQDPLNNGINKELSGPSSLKYPD